MEDVEKIAAPRTALESELIEGGAVVGACMGAGDWAITWAEAAGVQDAVVDGGSDAAAAMAAAADATTLLGLVEHADALLSTVVAWTDSALSPCCARCEGVRAGRRVDESCSLRQGCASEVACMQFEAQGAGIACMAQVRAARAAASNRAVWRSVT